ncbi:MAG TPA: acetyl-CoA carboxylase, carboxyltransferase subunit beta, partial [Saprospiraceae bacterium]|nr:acetyl-CoA carboxylase, carboxyltransferase subunit beta [Saprospiraceae bacterium]
DYHLPIGSEEYTKFLFTGDTQKLFENLKSYDFLEFTDLKSYQDRLEKATKATGLSDAITVVTGKIQRYPVTAAIMDFRFIGGSMGSVVGEKIARAIDYCIEQRTPLLIISKSGGARMMESAFSLMQMAKTSAKLSQLAKAGVPFFSLMTDPTTGGVSASYAMLGDINIAEPNALIGFAGPRVIKDVIKKDLPEGFQSSEYLLEHGFLDMVVHRKDLKKTLKDLLSYFESPDVTPTNKKLVEEIAVVKGKA